MVDEFRTSKTCHCCGDVLRGVVEREKNFKKGAPAGAVDRGVKHCARSTCSTFLDRDVNAALNMLKVTLTLLRGVERPQHLQRESVLITGGRGERETASTQHGVTMSPMIIRRGRTKSRASTSTD
jgi:transposase